MILDTGICSIFRLTNTAAPGKKPNEIPVFVAQLWYGELSFESSPAQTTDSQENVEIVRRIRVLRNRDIDEKAIVQLGTNAENQYKVTRVYSGTDKESGEAICDLSLSRTVSIYDVG